MTTTSSTQSSSSAAAAAASSASATSSSGPTLGKDDFLKLLMAQLANQDPLQPMDDTQFVAQLAQFSNVEQLQNVNTNLQSQLVAQASANETQTASLVGKNVAYNSTSVSLTPGTPTTFGVSLGSNAASVTTVITDSTGRVVRTLKSPGAAAGTDNITWDGRDDSGSTLPAGNYNIAVAATDSAGQSVNVSSRATGKVTGVTFDAGYAQLIVNGNKVKLSDVMEINQGS